MLGTVVGRRWLGLPTAGWIVAIAAVLASVSAGVPAHAARHALIVGVDKYDKQLGIEPLKTAGNDADALAEALKRRGVNFTNVVVLKDDKVRDKAAFNAELDVFLAGVGEDDEVLFFFAGHGLNADGHNLFLLPDAKSQAVYLGGKADGRPSQREKQDRSYRDWLLQVGVDEKAVEDAILRRKVRALVIIADAARMQLTGSKSAAGMLIGPVLPRTTAPGVFRLYSASDGQLAYGAPELPPQAGGGEAPSKDAKTSTAAKDRKAAEKGAGKKSGAAPKEVQVEDGRGAPKYTSLFTRVLLSELTKGYQSFGMLSEAVKREVHERSVSLGLGAPQTPAHDAEPGSSGFKLVEDAGDLTALCRTAQAEYQRLVDGVLQGGVGSDAIRRRATELDPCGFGERVASLVKFERLGTGFLTGPVSAPKPPEGSDPFQQCDYLAGSPHDKDLPPGTVPGEEITRLALAAISDLTRQARAADKIDAAIKACETAVRERGRVDRYKFNLGRSYYAMAVVTTPPLQRQVLLEKASRHLTEAAVELNYAAAYNFLGQMYLNGEVHETKGSAVLPVPPDREMAVKLMKRGAAVGDVLALYNLGLAYKNGEIGLAVSAADAYAFLSKAAGAGFVPAMVETAHAFLCGCGVPGSAPNEKRGIELLQDAAKRGSPEAMLRLGNLYKAKGDKLFTAVESDGKDLASVEFNKALVWYARAAEVGDARSQEKLADMLTKGIGVPSAQLEAAGRYWRLAAEGGSVNAQLQLADLIRKGSVAPRPQTKGKTEAGAQEIRDLYLSAFARGKVRAGFELARLFRTGYPELLRAGSEAIPKDPKQAIKLLWEVIARVGTVSPDSDDANPEHEVQAAFELIDIYDKGEHKLADGTRAISDDEIDRLKSDYGNPREASFIRIGALGAPINCPGGPGELMVLIWNSKRAEAPSDRMFDWFERRFRCRAGSGSSGAGKAGELGIAKETRDLFRREYMASLSAPDGKSFVDRMAELAAKLGTGGR